MKAMICTKDGMAILKTEILHYRVFMYGKLPADTLMENILIRSVM